MEYPKEKIVEGAVWGTAQGNYCKNQRPLYKGYSTRVRTLVVPPLPLPHTDRYVQGHNKYVLIGNEFWIVLAKIKNLHKRNFTEIE